MGRRALVGAGLLAAVLLAGTGGFVLADQRADDRYAALADKLAETETAVADTAANLETARLNEADWRDQYENIVNQVDDIEAELQEDRDIITAARDRLLERSKDLARRERALERAETVEERSQFPGDGTFVVGEDVTPGTYRSAGTSGCYYAFMSSLGAGAEIIDNNLTDGPAVVSLVAGDIFETSGCAEWDQQ